MERRSWLGRAEYVVVDVALVGGVLFLAILLPDVRALFHSEVAAAWVQAFGSIIAIAASAWIAFQAVERAHTRAQRGQRDTVRAAVEAAIQTVEAIEEALKAQDPRAELWKVYSRAIIDELMASLRQVPAYYAGTPNGVRSFTMFLFHLPLMAGALDRFMAGAESVPEMKRMLDQYRAQNNGQAILQHHQTFDRITRTNAAIQIKELRRYSDVIRGL